MNLFEEFPIVNGTRQHPISSCPIFIHPITVRRASSHLICRTDCNLHSFFINIAIIAVSASPVNIRSFSSRRVIFDNTAHHFKLCDGGECTDAAAIARISPCTQGCIAGNLTTGNSHASPFRTDAAAAIPGRIAGDFCSPGYFQALTAAFASPYIPYTVSIDTAAAACGTFISGDLSTAHLQAATVNRDTAATCRRSVIPDRTACHITSVTIVRGNTTATPGCRITMDTAACDPKTSPVKDTAALTGSIIIYNSTVYCHKPIHRNATAIASAFISVYLSSFYHGKS